MGTGTHIYLGANNMQGCIKGKAEQLGTVTTGETRVTSLTVSWNESRAMQGKKFERH